MARDRNRGREKSEYRIHKTVYGPVFVLFQWMRGGLLGIVALGLAACSATLPSPETIRGAASYNHDMAFQTHGFQRSYRIHFPRGYDPKRAYPLVIVIHGAFDTAEGIERFSGFSELADQEQFLVMYPNGIGLLGYLQHWNAGHCCGKAREYGIDDVTFIKKAVADFEARFPVDSTRIYVTGFSNGGMLAYLFGARESRMVSAIAPVSASFGGKVSADSPSWYPPKPELSLPVLAIHGLADRYVPFAGGYSERRGGTASFLSVPESVHYWVRWNGCDPSPVVENLFSGSVQRKIWKGCENSALVELVTLTDWGHYWPGPFEFRNLSDHHPLKGFDAAALIWKFFQQYQRESR